jgi:hypothetical protein
MSETQSISSDPNGADQTKTADQELQESMPSQAELDAQVPGHVPNAAERAAGGPSPWLQAAQSEQGQLVGTPPGDLYFTFERPDGEQFIASASSAEQYLRRGYKVISEQTIRDSNEARRIISPGSVQPAASGVAGLGGSGGTEAGPTNEPTTTTEPTTETQDTPPTEPTTTP